MCGRGVLAGRRAARVRASPTARARRPYERARALLARNDLRLEARHDSRPVRPQWPHGSCPASRGSGPPDQPHDAPAGVHEGAADERERGPPRAWRDVSSRLCRGGSLERDAPRRMLPGRDLRERLAHSYGAGFFRREKAARGQRQRRSSSPGRQHRDATLAACAPFEAYRRGNPVTCGAGCRRLDRCLQGEHVIADVSTSLPQPGGRAPVEHSSVGEQAMHEISQARLSRRRCASPARGQRWAAYTRSPHVHEPERALLATAEARRGLRRVLADGLRPQALRRSPRPTRHRHGAAVPPVTPARRGRRGRRRAISQTTIDDHLAADPAHLFSLRAPRQPPSGVAQCPFDYGTRPRRPASSSKIRDRGGVLLRNASCFLPLFPLVRIDLRLCNRR